MIVETFEPSSLTVNPYAKHLECVGNILDRIENYSQILNNQLYELKHLVDTNRHAIGMLQCGEQTIKSLEGEQEAFPRHGNEVLPVQSKMLRKINSGQVGEPRGHLGEACEVTNSKEICWTPHRPTADDASLPEKLEYPQRLVNMHEETATLLSALKLDLDRQKGGQEPRKRKMSVCDIDRHQQLIERVQCILETVDKMSLESDSVTEVKLICRRVISALTKRLRVHKLSSEHSFLKIVKSSSIVLHKNPYL